MASPKKAAVAARRPPFPVTSVPAPASKSPGKKKASKAEAAMEMLGSEAVEKDGPYYFVQRKKSHANLPKPSAEQKSRSPLDFWSRPVADFKTLEQAQRAFDHPELLHSFFSKMDEILNLIEANNATSDFSTNLARQMIEACTATIYCYGESGSGKSTLIRNLTGDPAAVTSHTTPGTEEDTHCLFKSGLRFIDTQGFRVPLIPTTTLGLLNAEWFKEYLQWERLLRNLRMRFDSKVATDRPLAIMYCHKAGHRVIPERIQQLISIGHMKLVPTFLVITDVFAIDDEALQEFRAIFRNIVRTVGFNARGKSVHLIEVNSQAKEVKGHYFEPVGMPQLASMILNALEPMDILTFTHRSMLGIGAHVESNKKKRRMS